MGEYRISYLIYGIVLYNLDVNSMINDKEQNTMEYQLDEYIDENNVGIDDLLRDGEYYVEPVQHYPYKKIFLIALSVIVALVVSFLWAGSANKSHYQSTEQNFYATTDEIISEWVQEHEDKAVTELVVGKTKSQDPSINSLQNQLSQLKMYSSLHMFTHRDATVKINPDKSYTIKKNGEIVYQDDANMK